MNPAAMLPTYNEAENIREILEEILEESPDIVAVVVDDNSPDETWRIAEEVGAETGRVRVLRRMTGRGRGYAGAEGFRYCVAEGFDPIIEMDADFSHDPEYIPEMLQEAETWDIVIGSRAVKGGDVAGRGLARRLITAGAAFYLKTMLGLSGVKDPTSGFRCFRRHVLESIHLETLMSPGPAIVTEVLFRCRKFRIKEIPILFQDREHGRSKFGLKAIKESLLTAARLRFRGR
jgi:dolichol-phosphate mannosyltransferase